MKVVFIESPEADIGGKNKGGLGLAAFGMG